MNWGDRKKTDLACLSLGARKGFELKNIPAKKNQDNTALEVGIGLRTGYFFYKIKAQMQ